MSKTYNGNYFFSNCTPYVELVPTNDGYCYDILKDKLIGVIVDQAETRKKYLPVFFGSYYELLLTQRRKDTEKLIRTKVQGKLLLLLIYLLPIREARRSFL